MYILVSTIGLELIGLAFEVVETWPHMLDEDVVSDKHYMKI